MAEVEEVLVVEGVDPAPLQVSLPSGRFYCPLSSSDGSQFLAR